MAKHDFIIIDGGIRGCTLASRLYSKFPSRSILLIGARPHVPTDPLMTDPAALDLQISILHWHYKPIPQVHLDNRIYFRATGKVLGRSPSLRVHPHHTCENIMPIWSQKVHKSEAKRTTMMPGIKKSTTLYSHMQPAPLFQKTEKHHARTGDAFKHGFEGLIITTNATSTGSKYPLHELTKCA